MSTHSRVFPLIRKNALHVLREVHFVFLAIVDFVHGVQIVFLHAVPC